MPSTSMLRGLRSGAVWLASATPEMVNEFLHGLSEAAFLALPWLFEFWALPHQIAPDGAWRTWVIMGGRGAGKTRAGAEWVRGQVEGAGPADPGRARRVALVGETVDQVREVMIFGESGIMNCAPPDRRPAWEAGRKRLVWPNGALAQVVSAHDPESLRGPQFDAAWADEYGCPAIDRGTNQPNLFYDPASSESAVPRASSGQRDDLIQMQYVRAFNAHWAEADANPISPLYGGRMVDMGHAYLWAWDARPYPAFPLRSDVWTDGPNYQLGHWLNGRATAQPMDAVICEIMERAGMAMPDVTGMHGLVRGYTLTDVGTARSAMQPLLLAGGVDALEREGVIQFRSRSAKVAAVLDKARLVADEDGDLTLRRAAEAEATARLRLTHADAEGDYQRLVVEAKRSSDAGAPTMDQETPVALLPDEARHMAERWLSEVRVGREVAEFVLPRSRIDLGVGDVVALAGQRWRIDRMEQGEALKVEAVRVERGLYLPGPDGGLGSRVTPFVPDVPVEAVFMDLPLMSGDEVAHAPHLAVAADPWPIRVAAWSSLDGESFDLNRILGAAAVMGESQNAMAAAQSGLWDRGAPLVVRLSGGQVAGRAPDAVLNGANLAAIGDGRVDGWELFQFAGAEMVGPETWALSTRLRGQAGTEAAMPAFWPAGSRVVIMSGAEAQLEMPLAARGLERVWRVGSALRGVEDADAVEQRLAFAGLGLRPYAVAHLRARATAEGLLLTWIRRTRIDGDSWASVDVPLGEEREAYLVQVWRGGDLVRQLEVQVPEWAYPAAWLLEDGPGLRVAVAQLSQAFGPGPFRVLELP
ncbi:baseplate megatron protein TIM-barrel domain-containing protein [Fuscovulum ytuae]|uniref:Glycoside hydrolase TIM-barrel-like domain-containing protein n=1 Tax=Fuscovulum ytuae TaxID=3042299 RepID=A0ABY8Q8C0_9RHOB|nr:glycoside hydrolase TIM-barrel-like domain-containing protein [Fuscovulum sp. YMD61]WGV17079.1 glycoside hydrolase TIM-barrel-like domain-containing protein [Fuscovulum sp. YMD61]